MGVAMGSVAMKSLVCAGWVDPVHETAVAQRGTGQPASCHRAATRVNAIFVSNDDRDDESRTSRWSKAL
jgi:predicted transcriptional regulator